ncbi:MAG TPA: DUF1501 domain-containing protein [Steroidobacteraceae bacterium]|jgi:uncharacterized protein (DUF1501 family)|nr:DUF1501 domain-containing protein [Steroidobacteraceae bacterium]
MSAMKRREFLNLTALTAGGAFLTTRLSFAGVGERKSRFVLVILRGALDGLAAVPPYGDPDYASLRRDVALRVPGATGGVLPLNGFFGLHPSLGFLGQCYSARELIVLHAVASPYRERSHFDGQDVLENGSLRAHALQTGWLNRALVQLPGQVSREAGVALGQNVPLIMRGPAQVTSWSPSKMSALDEETLARITDLYAKDPLLSVRLADALAADAMVSEEEPAAMSAGAPRASTAAPAGAPAQAYGARYTQIVTAAAGFLRQEQGPRVAVFDTTGWDTHANEGGAEGQLAGRLGALDKGLATLKQELGPAWADTAVLLVTEFGRTAAVNGTRGTDHGTGAAAFLLGGAVAGGRVIADWPGLSARALYQGRDVAATLDLRTVFKGILAEHLWVPPRTLEDSVFPDSAAAKPLRGLLRA